jgi:pimeloyl-ACP methyl ester carboxylesterase
MTTYTTYQDKRINYSIKGKGKTIVLLHGFLESIKIWKNFSNHLSKNYKVICIDLPGHGKSENIGDIHSMELMAEGIKSVLDELKVEKCVMIGHSMGGYVSLAFAEKYQDMLLGLGLFHSAAHADSEEAKLNRDRTIDAVKKDHKCFIQNFIPDLFAKSSVSKFRLELDQLIQQASKTSKKGIIAALEGMKTRRKKYELLHKIPFPFLMIIGKEDTRIPVSLALEQAAIPSHAECLILGNVGHMGFIEAEWKTLDCIRDFTRKCFNSKKIIQ